MSEELPMGLVDTLKKIATRDLRCDFKATFPLDVAGGNYDDAYYAGQDDGYIQCAQDILTVHGISWEEQTDD